MFKTLISGKIIAFIFILTICFNFTVLNAQFGINKVQYQDFEWKYIESKHFDIYYHDDAYYLARFAAEASENALVSIQNTLSFKLSHRVSFIIYNSHNQFQQTNIINSYMPEGIGGVTELYKNRIVVPYSGNWEQFRHVIHHELVHAVLNDMFYGGTIQSALSSGNMVQIPIWMNEGLAEYEGRQGYDVETDMFMRDVSQSEFLVSLDELDGYYAYRGGEAFYWYVAEKYGKERIGELINKLRISGNPNAAFKGAFQMSMEDFSDEWKKEMKKYYWPDIDRFKSPEDFAVRLTNHVKDNNFYNSSPAISPNGEKMAYISDIGGVFSIFVRNIEKKEEPKELVSSLRQKDFEELNLMTPGISWNPNGKELAVSAKAGGEDAIYIVDANNGDYEKYLLGFNSITSINWSPDGKYLAFVATVKERSDIYIYNLKTKEVTNLTNDIFSDAHPVWSPDSKKIYFVSDRGDNLNSISDSQFQIWKTNYNQSDIYTIDLQSKKIARITYSPQYSKTSIVVSPDEKKILYVSDKNGIGNIYEQILSTGTVKPKTNSLNGITQLSLSVDGSKLLFCTQQKAGYDIFLIRYPFDKNLDIDTLPLTKFREQESQKQNILDNIKTAKNVLANADSVPPLIGYGKYQVEFSRQQIIKPNPDLNTPVSGEDDKANVDTSYMPHDYKIKFSPDIILGNPGYNTYYGFQGLAQMLFSDVMGNHQIFVQANLFMDLRNSTIFLSYSYLPKIIDYSFSVYHSANYIIRTSPAKGDSLFYYRFRKYGVTGSASYPFDLFNRLEVGASYFNVSSENIDVPQDNEYIGHNIFVLQGRYVHDNALWGAFGPQRGSRYFLEYMGVPKLSSDGLGFMNLMADFRYYVPVTNYMSLAVRFSGGKSFGQTPSSFFLGGEENWINAKFYGNMLPFNRPEDYAFMQFPMPLRGFAINEINGTQYFLTNFEYRFPLFRALLAGPLPILIQSVMGCVFLDMGGAWSGGINSFVATRRDASGTLIRQDLLMSSGIGVRSWLLGFPLKIDIAWRNEFNKWSEPWWNFSLGLDW